jgi:uncharacterized membrane-anchored protein
MQKSSNKVSKNKELLVKVPKITAFFWVIKILTTGMGEATSDALVNAIGPAIAVALALIFLGLALKIQFNADRYVPWKYWLCVVAVAVFGTMAADGIHIVGVPYIISTSLYAIILAIIFWQWYKRENTLSIHSINTRKRETFYWLSVLGTFALGTAAGDMTATTLNQGFLHSGLIFIGIFLIPTIAYLVFRINAVFAFWFAYIITRPLGASFADWLGKPKNIGGRNLGDSTVSLCATAIIIILVGYLSLTHKDIQSTD